MGHQLFRPNTWGQNGRQSCRRYFQMILSIFFFYFSSTFTYVCSWGFQLKMIPQWSAKSVSVNETVVISSPKPHDITGPQWVKTRNGLRANKYQTFFSTYSIHGFECDMANFNSCEGNVNLDVRSLTGKYPDSKVHGANMGPTWVLSGPDGPHISPLNFAIRVDSLEVQKIVKLKSNHCVLRNALYGMDEW